jgi:hypothetical protein
VPAETAEETVSERIAAAAGDAIAGIDAGLQQRHRHRGLISGAGRVEAVQGLVEKRPPLVFGEEGPFQAADAVGEAVRVVSRHGGHAQDVAAAAVDHDAGPGFIAQATAGIALQADIDSGLERLAGFVALGLELAHQFAARRDFHPRRSGLPAETAFHRFFKTFLADLEAGCDHQGSFSAAEIFLAIGRADVADEMTDGGALG